jgi:hypothetical protein
MGRECQSASFKKDVILCEKNSRPEKTGHKKFQSQFFSGQKI